MHPHLIELAAAAKRDEELRRAARYRLAARARTRARMPWRRLISRRKRTSVDLTVIDLIALESLPDSLRLPDSRRLADTDVVGGVRRG